uniref:Uncharacterized protein n=1 Tax=Neobodo designis TaxID=312471 RepID=A0A7S1L626_NEODS|mmetsp:Transcript_15570/g.48178  ORF Transcript_15570/g.48178 Transcript_15570/m.48178 type:complete len:606 (+) Transcript_15570:142-1959(+)|eukprot:CAMPEP_0174841738 /NCGR_PEP_ID=MMETSP1114-20130205/9495_1 /TAXON_ID=312471 /ORGANISM="Neobodo designis, Strain CCAP 1951/1" /LENGTH=605 /DNA_ID=CAMNT_0016075931 /DNA_START=140 /DNA_END=1957 /DNA_ORIENTATION=+
MKFTDVFATALTTTSTVLLIAGSGVIIVRRMTDGGAAALKGIAYVTALITLPCLLFTRLAARFDEALVMESWPLFVFAPAQITFGYLSARVAAQMGLVSPEYAPLLTLALVSQNAVAFPYALLAAVRGVWWWDGGGEGGVFEGRAGDTSVRDANAASLEYAETLLFMFNINTSLCLWSIGNQTVARAAVRHAGGDPDAYDGDASSFVGRVRRFFVMVIKPTLSLPVLSSFAGIAIGLTPTLRFLATKAPGTSTVFDGLYRAGDACVPLTLILLGCSLAVQQQKRKELAASAEASSAAPAEASEGTEMRQAEQVQQESDGGEARPTGATAPSSNTTSPSAPPSRPQTAPPRPVADRSPLMLPEATSVPVPPVALTPKVPPSRPLKSLVPIEQNPSFDLPPADQSFDPAEVTDERPLAVASIVQAWRDDQTRQQQQRQQRREPRPPVAVSATTTASAAGETAVADAAQPASDSDNDDGDAVPLTQRLLNPRGWSQQTRFTAIVLLVRYLLMPFGGLVMLWLAGMRPTDGPPGAGADTTAAAFAVDKRRVMLLVMVVQSFSPCAVNGGVICTLHGYFPERHGLMLAVVYVACAVPCVMWMSAGLAFLG